MTTGQIPTATGTGTLRVAITNLTSPVVHGANAIVTVKTTPEAPCAIAVEYLSSGGKPARLRDRTAAANGVIAWTWSVGSKTAPGMWAVTVTCRASGMTGMIQTTLQAM